MKRPEYVAVVTDVYARLLEENRGPTREELSRLEQAFSRSGFTDWYWQGRHGAGMFGTRPENAPEPKELFAQARALYEKDAARTVDVHFAVTCTAGAPCTLTAADPDGHTVTVTGPVPEAARTRSLTAEELETRLGKTGGTGYRCAGVEATVDEGLSLPASAVNALRREALAALTAARVAPPVRRELPVPPLDTTDCAAAAPEFTVSVTTAAQLSPELLAMKPARIYVPLELLGAFSALPEYQGEWCAILPRVWPDQDEPQLHRALEHAKEIGRASCRERV